MIDEIKQKLQDAFGEYQFVEQGHYYIYKGNKVGISTTGLIHLYTNEFDSDTISQRVATKRGISQQEVLDEWKKENVHSTTKGNMIHEYAQSLWLGTNYEFDFSKVSRTIDLDRLKIDIEKLKPQADSFYNDFKDLYTLIGCELYLGDVDYDECGATDMLLYNNETGGIVVADFKTNKEIVYESKYKQQMKVPLQDYDDVNFIHYSLQLCNYAYKITKNTGIEIEDKIIVYFSIENNDYEIIKPLDMEVEAKQILEMRRVKNMKSLPILLIGKSGSGKSASLRNFTSDEVSIVNVLGKELPFRNKLTPVTTDDYERVLNLIKIGKKKTIVIDDAGYLITNQFMRTHSKGGSGNGVFAIYNDIADNFWKLISDIKDIEGNKTVYFLMHEDTNDLGITKPKTIGKMLDEKVCIEGMFTVALRSIVKDGKYLIRTKTDGNDIVKTPIGMFESDEIDNDLKEIDKVIREYYDLDKIEEPKKEKESK